MFKVITTAFMTIFLAELADKTQLTAVLLSGKTGKPVATFIGAMLAFALATLLAVTLGNYLNKWLSENTLKYISGAAFILVGVLLLLKKL